jgi:hypothetical protein
MLCTPKKRHWQFGDVPKMSLMLFSYSPPRYLSPAPKTRCWTIGSIWLVDAPLFALLTLIISPRRSTSLSKADWGIRYL